MIAEWYFKPRAAVQRDTEVDHPISLQQVVQPPAQSSERSPVVKAPRSTQPVVAAVPPADDLIAGHSRQSSDQPDTMDQDQDQDNTILVQFNLNDGDC